MQGAVSALYVVVKRERKSETRRSSLDESTESSVAARQPGAVVAVDGTAGHICGRQETGDRIAAGATKERIPSSRKQRVLEESVPCAH